MMIRNALIVCLLVGIAAGQDDDFTEDFNSTYVPRFLSISELAEATIHETVTFTCNVDDLGEYVILWKKGKENVLFASDLPVTRDKRFKLKDDWSLQITSVLPKDSGDYICEVSTTPPLDLVHNLNVLYPPTVKSEPRNGFVTAKEGETVMLSCDATGNPPPKISWKHAGRNYDINEANTFNITNIQKNHAGEYECIADNGVGEPAQAVITVDVVSAPKIKTNLDSEVLIVKEGEAIEITCESSGEHKPIIVMWKKPGGEKPMKGRDGDQIKISEAHRSHAGSYECIANNSLGIFTSVVIDVRVEYPPEIKVSNTWIHASEGSNVNLTCTVKGEPVPSVTWKKDNQKINHSHERYHLKTVNHHHILEIRHIQEKDFGSYECIAKNKLRNATENIHISGTPSAPVFTSKPHSPHSMRYTLSWMVKSHTPIDAYSVSYRKNSEEAKWIQIDIPLSEESKSGQEHVQSVELKGLEPATTYEALVIARNKFGYSMESEKFTFTTKNSEQSSSWAGDSSPGLHSSWLVIAAQAMLLCVCLVH